MGATTRIFRSAIFIAEFVTLAVMSIAIVTLVDRTQAAVRREANALEIENRLFKVRHLLNRADGALRGFILTGEPNALDDHLNDKLALSLAIKEFLSAWELDGQVQQATAGSPLQAAISELVGQWQEILAAFEREKHIPVDLIIKEQTTFARGVRPILDKLEQQNRDLVETRTAASIDSQRYLLTTTVAGSAFIIAIAAASLLFMHRREMKLQRLQSQLESTNENLESLVEQRAGHVREVNEEIQRFAYIISHDLRAPLVNIMGFTGELESLRPSLVAGMDERLSGDLTRDFDEALKFIKASIAKMDRLINAILQLSREGQRKLCPERVDMTDLLRTISETVAHQAREAGATIAVAPVPDLTSDRLALEQIFLNLVDNALKYLRPSSQGEIALSATETSTAIVYKVKDNGRGIEEKDKERIFDLFRRAGAPDKPGDGIGLAHTRALARRLGGSISVQSTPGIGSEFTVILPKLWPHSE